MVKNCGINSDHRSRPLTEGWREGRDYIYPRSGRRRRKNVTIVNYFFFQESEEAKKPNNKKREEFFLADFADFRFFFLFERGIIIVTETK